MLLENKVAVITGGSRGIGLATAKAFLAEGAVVVLCASRQTTADQAVESLQAAYPQGKVEGICPKLAEAESVKQSFSRIAEKYGHIDILVNNAGMSDSTPFAEYSEETFDKVFDLNVKGVYNCTRAAVDYMVPQGSGVILNTSSMVSIYGQPAGCAYPASKFAVNGMTKSLAREMGRDNIRVNAVAPGVTRTDMVAALPEEMVKRITAPIPLGRMGEPEEVADAFLFLASDMASYITGVTLSVDGAAMV